MKEIIKTTKYEYKLDEPSYALASLIVGILAALFTIWFLSPETFWERVAAFFVWFAFTLGSNKLTRKVEISVTDDE